jgi:hypothetical protein
MDKLGKCDRQRVIPATTSRIVAMPIFVECPSCFEPYNVSDKAAGRRFNCRACGDPVPVPGRPSGATTSKAEPRRPRASAVPPRQQRRPVGRVAEDDSAFETTFDSIGHRRSGNAGQSAARRHQQPKTKSGPLLLLAIIVPSVCLLGCVIAGFYYFRSANPDLPILIPGEQTDAEAIPDDRFLTQGPEHPEPMTVAFSISTVEKSADIRKAAREFPTFQLPYKADCHPLTADPAPLIPQIPAGSTPVILPGLDGIKNEGLGRILPLNSSKALFAFSVTTRLSDNDSGSGSGSGRQSGRVFIGSLPNGPFNLVIDSPEALRLLDHHQASGKTLLVSDRGDYGDGSELIVMSGVPEGKPVESYRIKIPPQIYAFRHAKMVSENVIVIIGLTSLHAVDVSTARVLYSVDNVVIRDNYAGWFSGSGKWMAIPHNKGFVLLESATGEILGRVPTTNMFEPGLAFHPDGRRIACCYLEHWAIWDIVECGFVAGGDAIGPMSLSTINWLANDIFLGDMGSLFDTRSRVSLWHYNLTTVMSPQLWRNSLICFHNFNGLRIATLPIPDEVSTSVMRNADLNPKIVTVRPGTKVRIEVENSTPGDTNELHDGLAALCERAGWKVTADADITVTARFTTGTTQEVRVQSSGNVGTISDATAQRLSLTPFSCVLEIRDEGVLWREEKFVAPLCILTQNGETPGESLRRYEIPTRSYLDQLSLPSRIYRKLDLFGMGYNTFDNGKWTVLPASF